MIDFHLTRGSGVATYLQLVHQVKHALRLGVLRPGDQLPTAKEVVARLAINPNTVLRAYRELEREGLVVGRPGLGTFVQRSLGGASLAGHARLRGPLGAMGTCRSRGRSGPGGPGGVVRIGDRRFVSGGDRVTVDSPTALEVTGLAKRYQRTWALRHCSLAVPAGRVVALVGPNGPARPHSCRWWWV